MDKWQSWINLPAESLVWARPADKEAFLTFQHDNGLLSPLHFVTQRDFSGWMAEDCLLYLQTNLGIDPHHGVKILPWLDFLDVDILFPTPKILFLKQIRDALEKSGKYAPPDGRYGRGKRIFSVNQMDHPRYPQLDIQTIFLWKPMVGDIPLFECEDETSQVHAVIGKIARLLDQGISPNQIRIVNASESDKTRLVLQARLFGFSVTEDRQVSLIRFPAIVRLIRSVGTHSLDTLIQENIAGIQTDLDRRVTTSLLEVVNRYGIPALDEFPALLKMEIGRQSLRIPAEEGAIRIVSLDQVVPDPNLRHFLLNFADSVLPPVRKDIDYLTDQEKTMLGQPTSIETNEALLFQTLRLLESIPDLTLFYAKKIGGNEVRAAEMGLTRALSRQSFVIQAELLSYSRDFDKVLYSKRKSAWERFGIRRDDHPLLRSSQEAYWHLYDARFNGIAAQSLDTFLKKGITLSATSLETFFECRFRYFLQYLMHFGPPESSLGLSLGNLSHFVLSKAFTTDRTVFDLAAEYRKSDPFLQEGAPEILAGLFVTRLKKVVELLRIRRSHSPFSDFSVEKAYSYLHPEDPNFRILGKIDLVQSYRDGKDNFISVVDYKTGNSVFREENFEKGIDIQLIFYLHLLSKTEAIPGMKPAGFYFQPVNLGRMAKESKKDPVREKIKMNGMTLKDTRLAAMLDPDGDIRGLTIKKDGEFHSKAKVADGERMEEYLRQMQTFIDKAVRFIQNGSFDITPLPPSPDRSDSDSCEYCPYQGICYLADLPEDAPEIPSTEGDD